MFAITWIALGASAAETVALRFVCPKRAEAAIQFRHYKSASDGQSTQEEFGGFTGTELWKLDGERCRVTTRGTYDTAEMPPVMVAMLDAMEGVPTTEVLDGTGALVDLEGVEALASKLTTFLEDGLADEPPEVQAFARQIAGPLVSKEALTVQATDVRVQRGPFWHGADLELEAQYAIGGTPEMPHVAAFFARRASCGARDGCVELTIVWTVAPESLEPAVEQAFETMRAALPPGAPAPELVRIEKTSTHRVWAEPETLRPWRHEKEEVVIAEVRTGQQLEETNETVRSEWVWDWSGQKRRKQAR